MRKKGIEDISYCNADCMNKNCVRNLKFYKPPTKFYSVCTFDNTNSECKWKLIKKE